MMKHHASKTYHSVILKQHVRYFTSVPADVTDRVLMGVRGTHDEDLLFRRFIAVESADFAEKTEKPVARFRSRLRGLVHLALRYRMLIGMRRAYGQQFYRIGLIGSLRAFALGAKYIGPGDRTRVSRSHLKVATTLSNFRVRSESLPKTVTENVSTRKTKPAALPMKIHPAASANLPTTLSSASLKIKNEAISTTKSSVKKLLADAAPKIVTAVRKADQPLVNKPAAPSVKTEEQLLAERMDRHAADFERIANIKPEDDPSIYSSPRAILAGERKIPVNVRADAKSKSGKSEKHEIDPALTALIEKARARGKRTSSFLSPEEIPYLIKDSQVHRTVFFLGTSYMFYNYPNTIYYTAYIMFAYFVYLCVSRYNKYIVWMSKDFEYAKFLSWTSEAYQRDLHARMQARYPHKVKKPAGKAGTKK